MTTTLSPPPSVAAPVGRSAGLGAALGVELAKLRAQRRTWLTLLGCLVGPVLVVVVLDNQQRPPKDTLYGRHIHDSGFAVALFVLTFASQWLLPFLTAIVAGDLFASEDHFGTWKTVLTRSTSRGRLFGAKCLAGGLFAVATTVVLAASTLAAGVLLVGHQPLTGLSGQTIQPGAAAVLVAGAWASALPPMLAFTAIALLLSVATRNPAVAVVAPIVLGLVSQLLGWLGGMDLGRRLLPTTPFDAWHGLLGQHRWYGQITQGSAVSAGWVVVCLGLAWFLFARRDVTGG